MAGSTIFYSLWKVKGQQNSFHFFEKWKWNEDLVLKGFLLRRSAMHSLHPWWITNHPHVGFQNNHNCLSIWALNTSVARLKRHFLTSQFFNKMWGDDDEEGVRCQKEPIKQTRLIVVFHLRTLTGGMFCLHNCLIFWKKCEEMRMRRVCDAKKSQSRKPAWSLSWLLPLLAESEKPSTHAKSKKKTRQSQEKLIMIPLLIATACHRFQKSS